MGNRLYVGNLSYQISTEELRQSFAQCGTVVDAKVMTDRETGQSRGFGFVTMSSKPETDNAISTMNGFILSGRSLRVSEAEDKKKDNGGSQNNFRQSRPQTNNSRPEVYNTAPSMKSPRKNAKWGAKHEDDDGYHR
jgi:cold-inducible RNA-binding protein